MPVIFLKFRYKNYQPLTYSVNMKPETSETIHSPLSTTALNSQARIQSIDILRGLIMVLMAIDHVRVYSGVPAGGPDVGIFFTRWITHFCAPGFAFFAGTSAFLYGSKIGDKKKLAQYLVTRGLLLVVLELTIIRFFWAFNVSTDFVLAGVIWMLGWSMVALAALIWLRPKVVGAIGLAIIFLQQLFGMVPGIFPSPTREAFGKVWEFIYPTGLETFNGVSILYVLIPWIGVMAAGYGFGTILLMSPERRRKVCRTIGLTAISLFLALGTLQILATSSPDAPPFIFRLLNQNKYPASQLFLMMTLGPMILLVPFVENVKGWFAKVLSTLGRVPFFYYLLHILVIHISALVVQLIRQGAVHHEWYSYAPFAQVPEEFRWSLPLLYLVFIIDVTILYFVCRWYARYKMEHPEKKWLAFI